MTFPQQIEALCRRHKIILHDHPETGSGEPRRSFFRANGGGEVAEGDASGIHFPCVVMQLPYGTLEQKDMLVWDRETVGFEVRVKVDDTMDWAGMEAAREAAKRIGLQLLKKLLQQDEEEECVFGGVALDLVPYNFTGPFSGPSVGCLFRLRTDSQGFDTITEDNDFNP